MNISMQAQYVSGGSIASNANIVFDSGIALTGNIAYNDTTGVITLLESGTYNFNWWVSTHSTSFSGGPEFALVSSQGDLVISNSPIKTGEVVGGAVINVTTPPVSLSLRNNTTASIIYSSLVPVKASITVVGDSTGNETFSAFLPLLQVSSSTQLTNWTTTSPYYTTPNFNPSTGTFTSTHSGRYSLKLTLTYSTLAALTSPIGTASPSIAIQRITPTTDTLIRGLFPFFNVNSLLITLRTILGSGTITLAGDIDLNAGDVIGVFYLADGLGITINLGGNSSSGIIWSLQRIV